MGAGHAGGRLAISLRELGYEGRVVLIGEEDALPYERPPLSKEMITGEAEFDSSRLGDKSFWQERRIDLVLNDAAADIDPSTNSLRLSSGNVYQFDQLAFATGANPRKLPVFDQPNLPATCLRDLNDARWIKNRLKEGSKVLVIGAGVIGLELASSVVKVGGTATVVEAAPSAMGRAVTPCIAEHLINLHRARGVVFHFNAMAVEAKVSDKGLQVKLNNDLELTADFAVVGIGIIPNDKIAEKAGIEVEDGILVDEQGRTSIDNIWAVGDVARIPMDGKHVRQETWRHADNHPRAVAAAMLGGEEPYQHVPGAWTDQCNQRLQIEGVLEGEEVIRKGTGNSEEFAAFYLKDGQLVGAAAFQNSKIIMLARRAIAAGQKPDPAALANPELKPKAAFKPIG